MGGEWDEHYSEQVKQIQAYYDKGQTPPSSYFFYDGKSLENSGKALPATTETAIISSIASLAEFIPGAGSIISGGLKGYVAIFMKPEESNEQSKDVQEMTKVVKQLETDLKQYFNNESFLKSNSLYTGCGDMIESYRELQIFEKVDPLDLEKVQEVEHELIKHTGSVGDTAFLSVLDKVREEYSWGENKRLVLILGLMTMYAECMLLECVLKANISAIYEKKHDQEKASTARKGFEYRLNEMRIAIEKQVKKSKEFMEQKKTDRRGNMQIYREHTEGRNGSSAWSMDRSVGVLYERPSKKIGGGTNYGSAGSGYGNGWSPTGTEYNHLWRFEDKGTRTWEITCREFNMSGKDYGSNRDEVRRRMDVWHDFYVSKLEDHIKDHFNAFDTAINKWSLFCTQLATYTNGLDKKYEQHIDGPAFYKRMCGAVGH